MEEHKGIVTSFTILLTGISGSGKSTLAKELQDRLLNKGIPLQIIDGDEVRQELGNLFGYCREERMKNSRVVRLLAKYLQRNKINTVIAIVAPYEEMRQGFKEFIGEGYVEVYVKCSYEVCADRDVKGYYQKQKMGLMENLNGADDVFEVPQNSDLVIDMETKSVKEGTEELYRFLERKGYVV